MLESVDKSEKAKEIVEYIRKKISSVEKQAEKEKEKQQDMSDVKEAFESLTKNKNDIKTEL